MREIKFRAWQDYGEGHRSLLYDRGDLAEFFDATKGDPIMQFTGLKDKNGKEIYEGDILNLHYPIVGLDIKDEYLSLIVVINFDGGSFWFNGGGYTDCNWHFYNSEDREVIGNIYENPELL
jgi:uncharacterized phage protein (TIGR01671 family)